MTKNINNQKTIYFSPSTPCSCNKVKENLQKINETKINGFYTVWQQPCLNKK